MPINYAKIAAYRAGVPAAIDRGTSRSATFIKDLAVQLAPEDQGDLKSTGRVEPEAGQGDGEYRVVFGGQDGPNKPVDYARHVEFGTEASDAQPFLTPAKEQIDVRAEIAEELRALARRVL